MMPPSIPDYPKGHALRIWQEVGGAWAVVDCPECGCVEMWGDQEYQVWAAGGCHICHCPTHVTDIDQSVCAGCGEHITLPYWPPWPSAAVGDCPACGGSGTTGGEDIIPTPAPLSGVLPASHKAPCGHCGGAGRQYTWREPEPPRPEPVAGSPGPLPPAA